MATRTPTTPATPTPAAAGNQTTAVAAGTRAPTPTGKKGTGLMILGIFVFILLVKLFFFNSSSSGVKSPKQPAWPDLHTIQPTNSTPVVTTSEQIKGTVTEKKEVELNSQYGEVVSVPDGFNFSFIDATEPYCATNKNNNIEECGKAGEDIEAKFGSKNPDNRELRFKSSNGKSGKITVMLISRY